MPTTYGVIKAGGITGATAASRYVGATTGGPPTTGTFAVGDYIVDQSGAVFICTTAGTPGTWTDMSSGKELGYAEVTTPQATTVTGANRVDATGLIVTVTVGARPIIVRVQASMYNSTAASGVALYIVNGAAGDATRTPLLQTQSGTSAINNAVVNCSTSIRLAPSPGSQTYKVQISQIVGNTANLHAGGTNPCSIQVVNC